LTIFFDDDLGGLGVKCHATASGTPYQSWPITIAGWIRWNDATNRFQEPFSISNGSTHYWLIQLDLDPGAAWVRYRVTGGGSLMDMPYNTVNLQQNTWYHVAAISDAQGSHRGYIDGANGVTDSGKPKPFTDGDRIEIGGRVNSSRYFNGMMAHWGVWDVGLTVDEVLGLATGRISPLQMRPSSLRHYYPMGPGSLTSGNVSVKDIVGDMHATVDAGVMYSGLEEPPLGSRIVNWRE